jgi:hypothetical protein
MLLMSVITSAALLACGAEVYIEPTAGDPAESPVAEPTEYLADRLSVGTCWNDPALLGHTGTVLPVSGQEELVPCEEPHDLEVFYAYEEEGDDYPEIEQMNAGCLEQFEDFVGTAYPVSVLDIWIVAPDSKAWHLDAERTVSCSVYDMTGESLVGTAEGCGR